MSGDAGSQTVFGTTGTISQLLDGTVTQRFEKLDQRGKVAAEYIWLGGTMADLRSKTKTLSEVPKSVEDLPDWNYDGSSTGQAPGNNIKTGKETSALSVFSMSQVTSAQRGEAK